MSDESIGKENYGAQPPPAYPSLKKKRLGEVAAAARSMTEKLRDEVRLLRSRLVDATFAESVDDMTQSDLFDEKVRLDELADADDNEADEVVAEAVAAAVAAEPAQPLAQDNATVPVARAAALEELSWNELLTTVEADSTTLDFHAGLNSDAVADELERKLVELADSGDVLMVEIRKISECVEKMPMAPILALMCSAADGFLRLRRLLVSTTTTRRRTPFGGYSADFLALVAG
jgi:hypothetical protein